MGLVDLLNPWTWRADRRGERELGRNEERTIAQRSDILGARYATHPRVSQPAISRATGTIEQPGVGTRLGGKSVHHVLVIGSGGAAPAQDVHVWLADDDDNRSSRTDEKHIGLLAVGAERKVEFVETTFLGGGEARDGLLMCRWKDGNGSTSSLCSPSSSDESQVVNVRYWPVAAAAGFVATFWLVGHFAAVEPGTFNWDAAAAAGTAYGTLTLALVTWRLVASAREDARGTLRLAHLAEQEQQARLTPFVFPWADREWLGSAAVMGQSMPFRSAGAGAALNVLAHVYWPSGNATVAPTTPSPGEATWLFPRSKVPSWDEVWGQVTYSDLLGRQWETRFEFERGPDGQIQIHLCAYGIASLLPQQAHPAGWERPNNLARICLPSANSGLVHRFVIHAVN